LLSSPLFQRNTFLSELDLSTKSLSLYHVPRPANFSVPSTWHTHCPNLRRFYFSRTHLNFSSSSNCPLCYILHLFVGFSRLKDLSPFPRCLYRAALIITSQYITCTPHMLHMCITGTSHVQPSASQYIPVHPSTSQYIAGHDHAVRASQYVTAHRSTSQYITVHHSTSQYITVHRGTSRCNTVQYSTSQL
jgi:hypothetical protein